LVVLTHACEMTMIGIIRELRKARSATTRGWAIDL
jgi:hypothetical protein